MNKKIVVGQRCRGWLVEMEREDTRDSLDGMGKRSEARNAKETIRSRVADEKSEKTMWTNLNNDGYPRHWI